MKTLLILGAGKEQVAAITAAKAKGIRTVVLDFNAKADGCALADELFNAYLKQVLVDGMFHADPHPGNIFLTDENVEGPAV